MLKTGFISYTSTVHVLVYTVVVNDVAYYCSACLTVCTQLLQMQLLIRVWFCLNCTEHV